MTIKASASRVVQEPAALAIPVTRPGSGRAFTDRIHAKQRHGCATRAYLDQLSKRSLTRNLVRRLERLGYNVKLQEAA